MVSQFESTAHPSAASRSRASGRVLAGAIIIGGIATLMAAALSPEQGERVFFVAMGVSLIVAGGWILLFRQMGARWAAPGGRALRKLLDDAPDACCISDGAGVLQYLNRHMRALPDTVAGGDLAQVLERHVESPAAVVYRLSRAAVERGIATETIMRTDGRNMWIAAQMCPQNRIIWRFKIAETEAGSEPHSKAGAGRTTVQAAIGPSEIRTSDQLLAELPVALLRMTPTGVLRFANAAARRLIGDGLVDGVQVASLLEGLSRPFQERIGEVHQTTGQGKPEVARVRAGGKERFLQVSLSEIAGRDGPSLLAVLSDATELKTLEAQFVQSQKMQAVGQLAGGVAHDFNNLLTAINGHCDLLLLRHEAGDQDHGDLIQIRQNANRAAGLVRQLLAFSRKQTLRPKTLNLSDILSEVTHLLNRLLGEKVTLSIEHGRNLKLVRVDERQFEQVIMNLVVNARDAMPKGGTVHIRTRNETLDAPLERDRASVPEGDYVVVEVSDTGSGIPAENIPKIFEPFFTTKRVGEGTGLGLSTVYGIIKQTGGFIFADSDSAKGTTFTIYLRAHSESAANPVKAPPVAEPKSILTGQGVVLLVEDEAPVRSFSARALRMRGYTVLEASSGEEALEVLSGAEVTVDVLVSDVIMPGMDGPTWVRQALTSHPDARVIFISGYTEDAFADGCPSIGNSVFLPKPFDISELTEKVKEQIEVVAVG